MIIYIDDNYKCHVEFIEGFIPVETDFFDGKCKRFIEGYRYVPVGETWAREDGEVFIGEMIVPFAEYSELYEAQLIYEKELAEQAFNILLGDE